MSVHSYCRRFANLLCNRPPTTDIQLTALEARLLGEFSLVLPYDFVEEQAKRACETLLSDSSDSQKQFAVSFVVCKNWSYLVVFVSVIEYISALNTAFVHLRSTMASVPK